jgi:hypothetical protein
MDSRLKSTNRHGSAAKGRGNIANDFQNWDCITQSNTQCGLFRFHRAGSDASLKFAEPLDRTPHRFSDESGSTFDTNRIRGVFIAPGSSKICVDEDVGIKRIGQRGRTKN